MAVFAGIGGLHMIARFACRDPPVMASKARSGNAGMIKAAEFPLRCRVAGQAIVG